MKEKADPRGHVKSRDIEDDTSVSGSLKPQWFDPLDPKVVIDLLPVIKGSIKQGTRVPIPVYESVELIATKIRERYPIFRINLDVFRSMLYAGSQVFDLAYLGSKHDIQQSKNYKMMRVMDKIESVSYDGQFVENLLKKLMEGYLSQGHGVFSRDKIIGTIEEIRPLLTEDLQERCDNFIEEDLNSSEVINRTKERIRKREYRERRKNINLVVG
jgi:hypothetical protein